MGTKAIPACEIDNNLQARFESYLYRKRKSPVTFQLRGFFYVMAER